MAKGQYTYCGFARGPHLKNLTSGVPSRLRYCEIFTVYTQFTNVAASCITLPDGPGVGDPWS